MLKDTQSLARQREKFVGYEGSRDAAPWWLLGERPRVDSPLQQQGGVPRKRVNTTNSPTLYVYIQRIQHKVVTYTTGYRI